MHEKIQLTLHQSKLTLSLLILNLSLEDFIKDLLVSDENHTRNVSLKDLIVNRLLTSVLLFICKEQDQVENENVKIELKSILTNEQVAKDDSVAVVSILSILIVVHRFICI